MRGENKADWRILFIQILMENNFARFIYDYIFRYGLENRKLRRKLARDWGRGHCRDTKLTVRNSSSSSSSRNRSNSNKVNNSNNNITPRTAAASANTSVKTCQYEKVGTTKK